MTQPTLRAVPNPRAQDALSKLRGVAIRVQRRLASPAPVACTICWRGCEWAALPGCRYRPKCSPSSDACGASRPERAETRQKSARAVRGL